ncbi:MAG TPA: uroporphyrinogen-III C-methyltransferase, partial [Acidimicrobiales bacterium]
CGPTQQQINEILIERGRQVDCVVRLKSGDPHVFGRAAEELDALIAAGVAVEVVPGVSSAIAAPAAAGIPLTTRRASSGFTVITAHQDPANDRKLDWDALARAGTTLVVLMGAARARAVAERLMAGGMAPHTPVAVVVDATRDTQEVTRTTLERLGVEPVRSPATIVIGAVAALDLRSLVLAAEGSAG